MAAVAGIPESMGGLGEGTGVLYLDTEVRWLLRNAGAHEHIAVADCALLGTTSIGRCSLLLSPAQRQCPRAHRCCRLCSDGGATGVGRCSLLLSPSFSIPHRLRSLAPAPNHKRKFSAARLVEIAQQQAPQWYGDESGGRGGGLGGYGDDDGDDGSGGAAVGTELGAVRVADLLRRTRVVEIDESADLLVSVSPPATRGPLSLALSLSMACVPWRHPHPYQVPCSCAVLRDLNLLAFIVCLFRLARIATGFSKDHLENLEAVLIEHNVGVVLVDSIAALARKDFGHQGGKAADGRAGAGHGGRGSGGSIKASGVSGTAVRAAALTAQAAALKRLADAFNLVVLLTNQVTANMDEQSETHAAAQVNPGNDEEDGDFDGSVDILGGGRPSRAASSCSQAPAQLTVISGSSHSLALAHRPGVPDGSGGGGGGDGFGGGTGPGANVVPALGNSWHHCVSTRLVLEQLAQHRTLTVTKSPIASQLTASCDVTARGLEEVAV